MITRLKALLAHRRMPIIAAILAIVLLLPALGSGLIMDDHVHKMTFVAPADRPGGPRGDWDLFRFLDDDPAALKFVVDRGMFPWWTVPGFRLAFLRPLASLWHAIDYRVWPDAHAFMHAESILVFALGAFFAGLFYRRILGATVFAGLAALMFAVDDAHSMVITWIANRHAILSLLFGIVALWAHDRARRDDWKPGTWLGPVGFALSMLAGESGASTSAYLFAYALFIDRAPLRARAFSLAPYVTIGAVWTILYKLGGYGAAGGTFYIDPLGQLQLFIPAILHRLPVLLAGQLAAPPSDVWMMMPPDKTNPLTFVSTGVLLILAAGLAVPLFRNRTAWFFAVGMVGSLVPACATLPGDRNLLFAGLGGFGLVASLFAAKFEQLDRGERVYAKLVAGIFVLFHLVLAPLLLPIRSNAVGSMLHGFTERAIHSFPDESTIKGRTVVVVSAPDAVITNTVIAAYFNEKRLPPEAMRILTTATQGALLVGRPDAQTLSVTMSAGHLHEQTSVLFRDPDRAPLRVGDRFTLPGMVAEIKSLTHNGKLPLRIDFHFDKPLEDASFVWIYWHETRYAPLVLPTVGEEKPLPVVPYGKAIEG